MFGRESVYKNFYDNPRKIIKTYKFLGPIPRLFKISSPYRDKPYYCWVRTARRDKYFLRVTDNFFWESKKIWD